MHKHPYMVFDDTVLRIVELVGCQNSETATSEDSRELCALRLKPKGMYTSVTI